MKPDDLLEKFKAQYNALRGIQTAEVTSATALTPALRAQMRQEVTRQSGRLDVELVENVDPDLIGGFVLRVGDRQLDDSVRSGLRKIRTALQENSYQNNL